MPSIRTPSIRATSPAAVLRRAEEHNRAAGHENAGPLSVDHGFVPARPPALELPPAYREWDDAARDLPRLYARLGVRSRLEVLGEFDAAALPAEYLQRAATVLGILVHAYHRVEPRRATPTPAALERAWGDVCARLDRGFPNLSYLDLIVANWRRTGGRVDLLVPTVGTPEEQIFYLTQLDMLDRGTPLVGWAASACLAADRDDAGALAGELERMTGLVAAITRHGLPRIDPRPGRPGHVDPVVWAKTVAPLAVPLRPGDLGPSGTASPMFALLDAVIGRRTYTSLIGDETVRLMAGHPRHWREFVGAVAAARLPEYAAGHPACARALENLERVYAGRDGLLGRHRMKAVGYLDTAFRVGRDVTISNFPALVKVSGALAAARVERPGAGPDTPFEPGDLRTSAEESISVSQLLRHHRGAERQWIGLGGAVIDVTGFVERHPGGPAPLATYLGTDASAAFAAIGHHEDGAIVRHALRRSIGRLLPGPATEPHERWLKWAFTLTQWANVLATDRRVRDGHTSTGAPAGELTPYTLQFVIEVHERFLARGARAVTEAVADLSGRPVPSFAEPDPHPLYAVLEAARTPDDLAAVDRTAQALIAADQAWLYVVLDLLADGVEALEQHRDPDHALNALIDLAG